MGNGLVVLFAVAALDVLFAVALRLCGPLESTAAEVGLGVLTVMGTIASILALRSKVRGPWVVALVVPATLSAAWGIAMCFALGGSMHFVRWAGLWTRGTDTAWMTRLTILGGACGIVFGIALALAMRGRAWTFGMAALVGALSIPFIGVLGACLAALAQLVLGVVALRDARAMRAAESDWHHGKQMEDARSGGPYRLPESAPLERLRVLLQTARFRAWGASTTMLLVTTIAVLFVAR